MSHLEFDFGNDIQYKKHNAYIKIFQVKNQLSLQQHRIFDTLIILLQKTQKYTLSDIKEEKEIEFDLNEFRHYLMSNLKTRKINRDELKDSVEELMKITLSFDTKTEEKDEIEFYTIFHNAKVDFKKNTIKFMFSKKFSSEYMLPTTQYTLLSANYINRLKKTYSRLLYQHFKMLIGKSNFRSDIQLSPDFIRNMLGIQDSKAYAINSQLTNKVINPSLKEINLETDIDVMMKIQKSGRTISSYYFEFSNKDDDKEDISLRQPSLINEDDVYNPDIFQESVVEAEIIENTTHQKVKLFEKQSDFRQYCIVNFMNKIMPQVTLPDGKKVVVQINNEGLLTYTGKRAKLTTPLAKYIWSALFFMQEDILNNRAQLKSSIFEVEDGNRTMNIFDVYEGK